MNLAYKSCLIIFFLFIYSFAAGQSALDAFKSKVSELNEIGGFITTDKVNYAPSQTVYIMGFTYDLVSHELVNSTILDMYIFDSNGNQILTQLYSSLGKNTQISTSFTLPPNISPGVYYIVGFHPNQKTQLFETPIFIHGANHPLQNSIAESKIPTCEFFIEGGGAIYGKPVKIIARVKTPDNKFPFITGRIVNDANELEGEIKVAHGVGAFITTIFESKSKTLRFVYKGKEFEFELPTQLTTNNQYHLETLVDKSLRIKFELEKSLPKRNSIELVLRKGNQVIFHSNFRMKEGIVSIQLPLEGYPPGVSELIIADQEFEVIASKFIYIPKKSANSANLTPLPDTLERRTAYELNSFISSIPFEENSITKLAKKTPLLSYWESPINRMLYLNDLPELYLASPNLIDDLSKNPQLVDYFLSTKSPFPLTQYYNYSQISIPSIVEGVLLNRGQPLLNEDVVLTIIDSTFIIFPLKTSFDGKIKIPITAPWSEKKIYFKKINSSKEDSLIFKPYNTQSWKNPYPEIPFINDKFYVESATQQEILIREFYLRNEKKEVDSSIKNNLVFDRTYLLDEYQVLPSFKDLVVEILDGIRMKGFSSNSSLVVSSLNKYERRFTGTLKNSPLIIIDNIPEFDIQRIFDISPANIHSISIIYSNYYFESLEFGGVIDIKTKNHLGKSKETPHYKVSLTSSLSYSEIPFNQTNNNLPTRTPDFRETLMFYPFEPIKSHNSKFITSDIPNDFILFHWSFHSDGLQEYIKPFYIK
jgi:hypothetical protein